MEVCQPTGGFLQAWLLPDVPQVCLEFDLLHFQADFPLQESGPLDQLAVLEVMLAHLEHIFAVHLRPPHPLLPNPFGWADAQSWGEEVANGQPVLQGLMDIFLGTSIPSNSGWTCWPGREAAPCGPVGCML